MAALDRRGSRRAARATSGARRPSGGRRRGRACWPARARRPRAKRPAERPPCPRRRDDEHGAARREIPQDVAVAPPARGASADSPRNSPRTSAMPNSPGSSSSAAASRRGGARRGRAAAAAPGPRAGRSSARDGGSARWTAAGPGRAPTTGPTGGAAGTRGRSRARSAYGKREHASGGRRGARREDGAAWPTSGSRAGGRRRRAARRSRGPRRRRLTIERQRDGLALDQRLAGDALVAPAGRGARGSDRDRLAVLEHVHQLVGEGVALLSSGVEPVGEDHPLRDGIVVGGGLLGEEVGEEPGEVEVGGTSPQATSARRSASSRAGEYFRGSSPTTNRRRSSRLWMTSAGRATGRREPAERRQLPEEPRQPPPAAPASTRACAERATRPRELRAGGGAAGSARRTAGPRRRPAGGRSRVRPEPGRGRRRARPPRGPAGGWRRRSRRPRAGRTRRGATPIGSPMTSAVASTPKSGVVRVNAASALGRYVLRSDMFAMKLKPGDHDALVEERGGEPPGEHGGLRLEQPATGGGTAASRGRPGRGAA